MKVNSFDKLRVNSNIFKAYDIRGIYPREINEKAVYLIGRAFVKFLGKSRPKIAVGRDNRLSSPALRKSLVKGLKDSGADIIDIGLSPTPALYFAVAHYSYDGGINITASHNPKEYNGLKLVREKAIPIGENTGLKQILKLAENAIVSDKIGRVKKKQVIDDYLKFNLRGMNLAALRPLKIVIDTANAVPGILIPKLAGKLPCKIYHIFKELDGSFPNHSPNPLVKENLRSLCSEIKQKQADFGVAFDGDGDRVFFVDEKGGIISADMIIALMAEFILKDNPGSKILYDIRSSRAVKEIIEENGGKPVMWRVGHTFLKEKMREENILFGGEFAGHFYHKKHYFCEAPLFVLLKIIEMISIEGKALSQLVEPYRRYFHSGEINFQAQDKLGKIKELEKRFSDGKIIKIDGLRVDFKDWWFNVRPSNTEPLLRLIIEAKTKDLLDKKKAELSALLNLDR
ncbi:MAG: phosphomannomutase/phosphoglucomutase [Patescibacteria group bacterium]